VVEAARLVNRRVAVAAVGTCGWLTGAARARGEPELLWRSRFEQGLADWGRVSAGWGVGNRVWVDDSAITARVLRVHLQQGGIDPGSMRSRGLPPSGTGFKARLLEPAPAHAVLHYQVRFAPGFDFVRGGKLPGLLGGSGPSGGRIPNGFDGYSLRLMWREHGHGEVYAYLPTSVGHGTSLLRGALRFVPGQWHRLSQEVRLNTPGAADGWVRLRQDGRWVGEQAGLRLRDTHALGIDGVFFDVFFGGSDDSWAARADTHIDFAGFEITRGPGAAS
jgi:hypothetical protein